MENCIFCKIIAGPQDDIIWQNETVVAFKDIHPDSPVHILIAPKRHIPDLDHLDDISLGGQILEAIKVVAAKEGVSGAYRVQSNNGRSAGQVIDHLHFHLLG
jgi:histidine triad (HIT) family protein